MPNTYLMPVPQKQYSTKTPIKASLIIIAILITTTTTAHSQNIELRQENIQSIQKLISTFKTKNKTKIADLIRYPINREYPLKDVKDKNDFIQRFDDLLDKGFVNHVANSKMSNWSEHGWHGVSLDEGSLWIGDNGKIIAINHQSPKEKQMLVDAMQADKNQLPTSLQNFERPIYLIFTKNYKIRIDEISEKNYRYAAWKLNNQKSEPDIIIENGVWEFDGSGGNHTITFKNNGYTYNVNINEIRTDEMSEASLDVSKQEKTILSEGGKIHRN